MEIEKRISQHKTTEGSRVTRIIGWSEETGMRVEHVILWTELTLEAKSRERILA